MTTIEIARRMAELGETKEALHAYELVLNSGAGPAERMEAAVYFLECEGDYKVAFSALVQLYHDGHFRDQILPIMLGAFYEPNVKLFKSRYERNVKLLQKYPYLFRKDFIPFDELPLIFIPFDDSSYTPFDTESGEFRDFVNVKNPVVSRNFFRDLEKPILADNVYSQYELEYLVDNVRPSEWVGRENHIYLHYTDWAEFCSWLSVLTVRQLLERNKVVFLIGDELAQYPINFKKRFGIDYSQYPVQPVHIREVNKLIYHAQLSSSNGGDFFNEIFDSHPNLFYFPSTVFSTVEEDVEKTRAVIDRARSLREALDSFDDTADKRLIEELYRLRNRTDKDFLVVAFMQTDEWLHALDPAARIVPALFFQPHFRQVYFTIHILDSAHVLLESNIEDVIRSSPIFKHFKYVKAFVPMRRFTTSYGSTVRFVASQTVMNDEICDPEELRAASDILTQRVLNRSFMRDPEDRFLHDAVVVRFEDGKLNPRATFTRLAAFLDLPYTESMTYCSEKGLRDVQTEKGNAVGFDPVTVYRTYEDWTTSDERRYIEYFLRDAYAYYGYDFHDYDGSPVDKETALRWIDGFTKLYELMRKSLEATLRLAAQRTAEKLGEGAVLDVEENVRTNLEIAMKERRANQIKNTTVLMEKGDLRFVNRSGQPFTFVPLLQPDPDLLDQPLYH